MKNSKSFWWFTLASCAGVEAIALAVAVDMALGHGLARLHPGLLVWISGEAILGVAAVQNLRRLYREIPPVWTGRWQLRLSDLLAIAFFAGITMTIVSYLERGGFTNAGAVFSLLVVFCFTATLLYMSRVDGNLSTVHKWAGAFALMIGVAFTVVAGIIAQLILLGILGLLFCH